jgi:hypothetical protein
MPIDARHELFCRFVAHGATPATAARMIGHADPAVGEALMAEPELGRRVADLSAEREAGHAAMFARIDAWLNRLVDLAIERGQVGNALRAIERLMHLHGMTGKGNPRLPAVEKAAGLPLLDELLTALPRAGASAGASAVSSAASPAAAPAAPAPVLNRRQRRALEAIRRRK